MPPCQVRTTLAPLLFIVCANSHAALLSRAGGQAYYDTTTNLTWVADANLASTSGYCGTAGNCLDAGGSMTWPQAHAWPVSLNSANYLGVSDWRLPTVTDTGPSSGCDFAYTGTDCGYNVDLSTGEMARMFYSTLGNTAAFNANGDEQPCFSAGPNFCLTNTGPFAHLHSDWYWSDTEYAPDNSDAWIFYFAFGFQASQFESNGYYAWAVRTGDIGNVSFPDADSDGVADAVDDCKLVVNSTQRDTDGDGYGNLCDPDFNGDGTVNINDFNRLKARLNISPVVDVDTDLDGNGAVNINDLNRLKSFLGKAPGPSGYHPNCPPTCP